MDGTTKPAGHGSSVYGSRCAARSKRSGEGCKRAPIPGGTVCTMHGGAAPQVRAAAVRRLQEQAARVACWKMGVPGFGGRPDDATLKAARDYRLVPRP